MSSPIIAMRYDTPLREQHDRYVQGLIDRPVVGGREVHRPGAATAAGGRRVVVPEIEFLPYGPRDESGHVQCEIIGTFGEVQSEYAAIRSGAGLLDCPHRGTIRVTGPERIDFLNRMLTAELKDLAAGDVRESFWLNRKGRIEADLMLVELGEEMLIDVDVHALKRTMEGLESFLFAEDVAITSAHESYHRIALYGKDALAVIGRASGVDDFALDERRAATVTIAGQPVVIARCGWADGEQHAAPVALHLFVQREHAPAVWEALARTVDRQDESDGQAVKLRVRPIGWHAFNIARIEHGVPLFNVDFGADNLPHETGVLDRRVSFTKGCFLGQEVVARMQHLGRPKMILVGLRMGDDLLPMEGAQVFAPAAEVGSDEQIGMVTSSTLSPLLGAQPVAFAMLRHKFADTGREVVALAEGQHGRAVVSELNFLARPGGSALNGANPLPHQS